MRGSAFRSRSTNAEAAGGNASVDDDRALAHNLDPCSGEYVVRQGPVVHSKAARDKAGDGEGHDKAHVDRHPPNE